MNGADALISALRAEGCETIFGYPGGAIMPVYDALHRAGERAPTHVLVRHEQAAALAADGWARVRGEPGVCLATSGPGAANLVTGIANARLDSIPMVAVTGQVATEVLGTDAFQELDVFGLTMPIVKHSFLVRDADQVADTVHEAFALAREGRPGPVLIDLPKDVQLGRVSRRSRGPRPAAAPHEPSPAALQRAAAALAHARRPVVYAGGGVSLARAELAFRAFVESQGLPTVCTLKGLGLLPRDHPLFLGMLGMHGSAAANLAAQEADLLIVIGARFDDRATGRLSGFAPGARVLHLDIDPAEVGKLRRADVRVLGDLSAAMRELRACGMPQRHRTSWRARCQARRQAPARGSASRPDRGVHGPELIDAMTRAFGPELIVSADVGQHQMWVAQRAHFASPRAHLSSGGLGTMGFGIPAAIGAALAKPGVPVLAVTGDGSIMMNLQELATIRRYALPVKILLLDNARLGMVRQWQELFFDARYSEIDLSDNPDFTEVARAMGIPAFRLEHRRDVPAAVERMTQTRGPLLCHCVIDHRQGVWPLVPPGHDNGTMLTDPHDATPPEAKA